MATLLSVQVAAKGPTPSANAATDIIPIIGDYVMLGTEASGAIIEMCALPPGYVPVDMILDTEDLGTTATADVGILSGTYGEAVTARTMGAEFMTGKALGTTGIYRMDVAGGARIAPTSVLRGIGVKLSTVAVPTAGAKMRLTVMARPKSEGV